MPRAIQTIRNMSGGVKGIRYTVEQLNKYVSNDSSKYGIPYPVVNNKSILFSNKKRVHSGNGSNAKFEDISSNSYTPGKYNIFNISNMKNILVSGPDCKNYLNRLVTCDNRIMNYGTTSKSLALNANGTILGVGMVNRWNKYYSLIMDAGKSNNLMDHFFDNKSGFNVSVSKNMVDHLYLIKGPESVVVIEKIMNYLKNNTTRGCKAISSMKYQTNVNFPNQFIPNNSFSVINTPHGYIMSLNKQVVTRVFDNLNLNESSESVYETNRIESGQPCFTRDLSGGYNPIEANLHSHFSKNYEYSKRGPMGPSFYGKIAMFNEHGIFKRYPRTRVMLYSCEKGLIPPENSSIYVDTVKVGSVTSSTSSSYLKCIVAMGYVNLEKTFNTRSFSIAREIVKKVEINGNSYFIKFL
jgi:glycine cleavage system aminomethyltransferase T